MQCPQKAKKVIELPLPALIIEKRVPYTTNRKPCHHQHPTQRGALKNTVPVSIPIEWVPTSFRRFRTTSTSSLVLQARRSPCCYVQADLSNGMVLIVSRVFGSVCKLHSFIKVGCRVLACLPL